MFLNLFNTISGAATRGLLSDYLSVFYNFVGFVHYFPTEKLIEFIH